MKSFMFVAFVAIVLVLGLNQSAQAQGYVSGGVNVTAAISTALIFEGIDGDLGELTQGQCYTFHADQIKSPDPAVEGFTSPGFILDGNPWDNVEVSVNLPFELFGDAGGRMIATNLTYGANDTDDPTTGFNTAGSAETPFTVGLDADGHASVFFGMYLCVPVGAQAGTYNGQIEVSAHYLVQP
jgi:hypothetical protein